MRVVIAPDSFKESMTALQAASAIARGVARVWPDAELRELPLADGGEGTLATLAGPLAAEVHQVETTDAYGRPIRASYGLAQKTAIIESATVIGLGAVPLGLRDPTRATSLGLAALFRAALDAGATRLIVGLGGTATSDAGAGLLAGLGARLLAADGSTVPPTPAQVTRLHRLDISKLDPRITAVRIELACDVTNPLLGPQGAATIFAPQKGALPAQLPVLEAAATRLADAWVAAGLAEVRECAGAGAAGGLGAALLALGGRRRSGFEVVADLIGLETEIAAADLVITGEGSLDAQTASGKALSGVLELARRHQVPVIALAGRISEPEVVAELGFAQTLAISPKELPLPQALRRGPEFLEAATVTALTRAE